MANPRQLAFQALQKILKDHSYSNLTIAGALKGTSLSGADKSFFTTLVYGVLERKITLDYNLSLYLKQPLKKLNPKVYLALLLGAYQLLFLDHVPDHAAISESVNLTKKNGAGFASGLCNAVLRKVAAAGLKLPEKPAEGEDLPSYFSIVYSVPVPLVNLFLESYGREKTEGLLKHALGPQPFTVRVNTTKVSQKDLLKRLSEEGVTATPHPFAKGGLILDAPGDITALPSFSEGLFHVQDAASQLCCANVAPAPGEVVYDLCAAPGGKSCTMAELMDNTGTLKAFDISEKRVGLIAENATRLGLTAVEPLVGDATEFNDTLPLADKVLADVPCGGFGDIGRKPEIRFRDPGFVDNLTPVQYDILNTAERYLKPGGRLVYSTCSLNPKENEDVVARFLDTHPGMTLLFQKTYFPQDYQCDGFFNAVLLKEAP